MLIGKLSLVLLSFASLLAAEDTPLWEPGKIVSVEQVSTPAKEPDPTCHSLPRGTTPPVHCRPAYLRAEQFWRVTVDVGNKRFVVRPYRAPKLVNSFSDAGPDYVDPNLPPGSPVEVAVLSTKAIRFRADQGTGTPAIVDTQQLLSKSEAPPKAELPPASRPRVVASATPPSQSVAPPSQTVPPVSPATSTPITTSKVVLLESGDFREMEIQEFKSQDIGDGAAVYSFAGNSSPIQTASNTPVFLVLAESDVAAGGSPELSRLQVGKGNRQLAYSAVKNHSASSLPISVTAVSSTVRKFSVKEPLAPGEYVVLLENSNRGFLFKVR